MISSTRPAGRRRARFAALLAGPDDAGLREAAVAAARSQAAARDLALEADRVWPRLTQAERDLLGYHVRANGVALALERVEQQPQRADDARPSRRPG